MTDRGKFVEAFEGVVGKAYDELEKKGQALYESVKEFSDDVAEDVKKYGARIAELIALRLAGEVRKRDADIAIQTWEQAVRSALKKLKVFTQWELHKQLFDAGSVLLRIAGGLLGDAL